MKNLKKNKNPDPKVANENIYFYFFENTFCVEDTGNRLKRNIEKLIL